MSLNRETSLVCLPRAGPAQLLACLALLLLLLSPRVFAASPAQIDLRTFDALKKTVTLANGQTLAYVPLGDPHGAPLVLIHGYTDNARD